MATKLMIPIDFKSIAKKYGVRKGNISYSDFFNSWVLRGHPEIDAILIDAPYSKGQVIDGKIVKNVVIKNNNWCVIF